MTTSREPPTRFIGCNGVFIEGWAYYSLDVSFFEPDAELCEVAIRKRGSIDRVVAADDD
jgi:hypothetical protein